MLIYVIPEMLITLCRSRDGGDDDDEFFLYRGAAAVAESMQNCRGEKEDLSRISFFHLCRRNRSKAVAAGRLAPSQLQDGPISD